MLGFDLLGLGIALFGEQVRVGLNEIVFGIN